MNVWEPTIGKWEDDENYDIKEPVWVTALKYAGEKYLAAGVYWEYKDGSEKKKIPYINFVKNVLKILGDEVYITDYRLRTLGALARVCELSGCTFEDVKTVSYSGVIDELREFPPKRTDNLIEYLKEVFNGDYRDTTMLILVAELLYILRAEKCPCDDWEKDIEYYFEIEKLVDTYLKKQPGEKVCFLCERIKEQLATNRDISRNINKKPEELFDGWND